MRTCKNPDCAREFEPSKHNQIYCDKECSKIMTNAKIMGHYYDKKDRKSGKKRFCERCDAPLSRYNATKVCSSCATSQSRGKNGGLLNDIASQWNSQN